ncbi:MAG: glycosyltransferase family 4 protein [Planctomycetota bacterium]|nr:glycosyltransferase family 4 protein [Planctomycetota bacterium]
MVTPTIRLAIVQHGDYRDALDIMERDAPEPYFGMKDSVGLIERFLEGTTYCLISVDAPNYRLQRPGGEVIGLHRPNWPKLSKLHWSWKVWREVRRFRPTHLLMRTGGLLAFPTLQWCNRHGVNSLVVMAGYMKPLGTLDRHLHTWIVNALNHSNVKYVTNHRRPATLSTIEAGVHPDKVLAWDLAGLPRPEDRPTKELDANGPIRIFFAGTLKEGKGIGDLVDSLLILQERGRQVVLTVCGDGEMRAELQIRSQRLEPGSVHFLGRVGNDEVQRHMRESNVVCVPSRSNSAEGLPFTVTEAFASRTPLIATDHPAMTKLLIDEEGLLFVPSANPSAMADAIERVAKDPELYRRLSESSVTAFHRLASDITFDALLWKWREQW